MDVFVTYSKFTLSSLSALAAACSKNIRLIETKEENHLSMSPTCEDVKSPSAIICFIQNIDPIDKNQFEELIFEEKFIKPSLYNYYKSCNDKKVIVDAENAILLLEERFSKIFLSNKLNLLELVIWNDLFLLSVEDEYKLKLPSYIKEWLSQMNGIKPTKKAVELLFGTVNKDSIKKTVNNIKNIQQHTFEGINSEPSYVMTSEIEAFINDFVNGSSEIGNVPVYPHPKLPQNDAQNILVTSALPYVNNVPHLGNLIGSTLSADFYVRYCRNRGKNVLYVCGTDEYGTATEVKATMEGCSPKEICDKYYAIHKEVYDWFEIEFDVFGRTSDDHHKKIVTDMFKDVNEQGYISKDSVQQLMCLNCNRFLADRFVEGICPGCKYQDARGDQCDGCGKLINAIELIEPRCKLCSKTPEIKNSKHLFLDLDKLQEAVSKHVSLNDYGWSTSARAITRSWLNEQLRPRCITRDLSWGVQVPLEDYNNKVFYVWFDAVLGYLSITAKYTDKWHEWWLPSQKSVHLIQFMAKDNVPFHSVVMPAILIASGKQYTKVETIAATEYLNYESTKFSKSRGVGVFGSDVTETGLDPDIWRFYLAVSRPESQDSSFVWADLAARVNGELLNNLGNFIHRSLTFIVTRYAGTIPTNWTENINEEDGKFIVSVASELKKYCDMMDSVRIRDGVSYILNISRLGNGYLQMNAPWKIVKLGDAKSIDRAGTIVSISANICVLLGTMLSPIMPNYAKRIHDMCNAPPESKWLSSDALYAFLKGGHKIGSVAPMFTKIEDEFVDVMRQKFGK